MINDWIEHGITPLVDHAIFVFLKFISGVVPTINYVRAFQRARLCSAAVILDCVVGRDGSGTVFQTLLLIY